MNIGGIIKTFRHVEAPLQGLGLPGVGVKIFQKSIQSLEGIALVFVVPPQLFLSVLL